MVNPDLARSLNTNSIASGSKDLLNLDIANDHVRFVEDAQADSDKCWKQMIRLSLTLWGCEKLHQRTCATRAKDGRV